MWLVGWSGGHNNTVNNTVMKEGRRAGVVLCVCMCGLAGLGYLVVVVAEWEDLITRLLAPSPSERLGED